MCRSLLLLAGVLHTQLLGPLISPVRGYGYS
eukprot:COSAG02_NODE_39875_length_411_cov_4.650641_1_plen_30_part_01